MNKELLETLKSVCYNVSGPVIFNYVNWILEECLKKNIKKIYFLARDGYILQKVAQRIIKIKKLKIECRYLYCSRFSLRIPTYNFIGEEKYKLIFNKGISPTLASILKRVNITNKDIKIISEQIGIIDETKELNNKEFETVKNKLIKNELFNKHIYKISQKAYNSTIKYLKQEKVFDDNQFVLVDSGWAGSLQRSFRQLFNSQNFNPQIIGFYFGLYYKTRKEDGEFLTYYFNFNSKLKHKANFNNSLFECLLSAPHGMTVCYKDDKTKIIPILNKQLEANKIFIKKQIEYILNFVDEKIKLNNKHNLKHALKQNYKILKRIMTKPSNKEVELFSNFYFCDDISECYTMPIAGVKTKKDLKSCAFVNRLFTRFIYKKGNFSPKVYWPYSCLQNIRPKVKRCWYYLNFKMWDYFRFLIPKK